MSGNLTLQKSQPTTHTAGRELEARSARVLYPFTVCVCDVCRASGGARAERFPSARTPQLYMSTYTYEVSSGVPAGCAARAPLCVSCGHSTRAGLRACTSHGALTLSALRTRGRGVSRWQRLCGHVGRGVWRRVRAQRCGARTHATSLDRPTRPVRSGALLPQAHAPARGLRSQLLHVPESGEICPHFKRAETHERQAARPVSHGRCRGKGCSWGDTSVGPRRVPSSRHGASARRNGPRTASADHGKRRRHG